VFTLVLQKGPSIHVLLWLAIPKIHNIFIKYSRIKELSVPVISKNLQEELATFMKESEKKRRRFSLASSFTFSHFVFFFKEPCVQTPEPVL
jgi:hypothetical protein